MEFYNIKHSHLEYTKQYLSQRLSDPDYGYRYDDILKYIMDKNYRTIASYHFRYDLGVSILTKLIEDAGYIKHTEHSMVNFRIIKEIKFETCLDDILEELPYKLTASELERLCYSDNYSKWYMKNKQILKDCGCEFLHCDPYNRRH